MLQPKLRNRPSPLFPSPFPVGPISLFLFGPSAAAQLPSFLPLGLVHPRARPALPVPPSLRPARVPHARPRLTGRARMSAHASLSPRASPVRPSPADTPTPPVIPFLSPFRFPRRRLCSHSFPRAAPRLCPWTNPEIMAHWSASPRPSRSFTEPESHRAVRRSVFPAHGSRP